MSVDEGAADRARELLARVPLQPELWTDILQKVASATGSRGAQLIGVADGAVVFNLCHGVPDEAFERWAEVGGGDVRINPIMRAIATAPLMTLLSGDSLLTGEELAQHRAVEAVYAGYDVPHRYFVMLRRSGDQRLSLSLFRSTAQGPLTDAETEVLTELLPAVAMALETQERLNGKGSAVARGVMEALGQAALVCDAWGRVLAATEAGSRLADAGHPLTLRNGRLVFTAPSMAGDAQAALAAALRGQGGALQTFASREPPGHVIEIHRLPSSPFDHGAAPACLICVRPDARGRSAFDGYEALTGAERAVAGRLLQGDSTKTIADSRQVSPETVRGQVKSLYAKLGVTGRSEFMARFR